MHVPLSTSCLPSQQQAKQGVCDIVQSKSRGAVNRQIEVKVSRLKKQNKATIKALKQTHKNEIKDLQKKLQAWENGVSACSSLLYIS
jgi:hypothetical protein